MDVTSLYATMGQLKAFEMALKAALRQEENALKDYRTDAYGRGVEFISKYINVGDIRYIISLPSELRQNYAILSAQLQNILQIQRTLEIVVNECAGIALGETGRLVSDFETSESRRFQEDK